MVKIPYRKLFLIVSCILLAATGCNKDNDISKIASTSHDALKNYNNATPEEIINQGVLNLKAGNLEKAVALLNKFTTYYPDNPIGQLYLGQAHYKNKNYEQAIMNLKKAYLLDSSTTEALLYLGKSYKEINRNEKAINALFKYLVEEPDSMFTKQVEEEINLLAKPVVGNNVLGRVFVTDEIIKEERLALRSKACFKSDIPAIYSSLELLEAPFGTKINVQWIYNTADNQIKELKSESFIAQGSKNALLSIKRPSAGWQKGKYSLLIKVNSENNTSFNFYVF